MQVRACALMVLSHKIGQERSPGLVVFLFIITFGIYGIYWHYKAHQEAFVQFELEKEGRDQGLIWLILGYVLEFVVGFIGTILLWVYLWGFVGNVQYIRQRFGLRGGITPGGFIGFQVAAMIVVFAFMIGGFLVFLGGASLDTFDDGHEWTDEEIGAAIAGVGVFLLGVVVAMVLQIVAYVRLQNDINGIWRAYDQRMGQLP